MNRVVIVLVILILMLLTAFNSLETFSGLQASPIMSLPLYDGLYIPENVTLRNFPEDYTIQSRMIPQPACKWRLAQNAYHANVLY